MKNIQLLFFMLLLLCISCNKFLDKKPNQKMAVPKTLEHADLLLNDYTTMNMSYPVWGSIASDDYYVDANNWQSLSDPDEKQVYIWSNDDIISVVQWQNTYKVIYQANQVLQILKNLDNSRFKDAAYARVKGGAYFFRAFAFHQLAVVHAATFTEEGATRSLGIPLRLDPDLDQASFRATLEETYGQIVADYKEAAALLPISETKLGRPAKAAAYAGLARVYLDMQDYMRAYAYSDSALRLNSLIMDFNELDPASSQPIARFNREVLFSATTAFASILSQTNCRVDSILVKKYLPGDLRKGVFFQAASENNNSYLFKGSYDGSDGGIFVGLTTVENLLIHAESAVRIGKTAEALSSLNKLLENRWSQGEFSPVTENNVDNLLQIILLERRKELLFKGLRWADLKRLNLDQRFKTPLTRTISNLTYKLEPNSLKYAVKIPKKVIDYSGMSQNPR
ncbi:RagB/SusD family nutrient uptake outer membrane protein [Sphingobacterium sp. DR205]|uniref:RagB/SusD family nutrient uptake outer membrane protein n=1 Tax=Sphingobacterium sp. DR205 TaxID=2713573 RepID=UPI0013E44B20|nr:RagB/SusD family nutrient uptake outer membrane protein [Sphingobacterium sp. DR205]QIH33835.1 RagB/SusD family nutrient uptake outer membrane protein [Sphingobacterium sp. DR205]